MVIIVPGAPVPKARPRFTRSGHTYTPAKTADHERKIQRAFFLANGKLADGPLHVRILAVLPIPKSTPKKTRGTLRWHYKRPDTDNIAKTVLDALNGLAYTDDGQISWLDVVKIYGDEPHTEIEISEIREET